MTASAKLYLLGLLLAVASCTGAPKPGPRTVSAELLPFTALAGWETDRVQDALPVFSRSCARMMPRAGETAPRPLTDPLADPGAGLTPTALKTATAQRSAWRPACEAAARLLSAGTPSAPAARDLFETHFQPVVLKVNDPEAAGDVGLFTGYFEPTYKAAPLPTPEQSAPVLTRPDDLVTVDLGAFREDLKGKRIAGQIADGRLIPYADHEDIITRAPTSSAPLGYVNPNDLLFLQIQGSGRLEFPGGQVVRVGYAAQNGHAYVPVGRTLVHEHGVDVSTITMQSIYAWLEDADDASAAAVRYSNPSYVFFRPLTDLPDPTLGPLGAQQVQLTPGRSLAVDHRHYAYGTPVWLQTSPVGDVPPINRLFVAQDTGGAIRGEQRGDVFFGDGPDAAHLAGQMKAQGEMVIFVPKTLFAPQNAAADHGTP